MGVHWLSFLFILYGVTACENSSTDERTRTISTRSQSDLIVERNSAGECEEGEAEHGNGDACNGDGYPSNKTADTKKKPVNKIKDPVKDPKPELDPAAEGDPNIIVFRITAGTNTDNWNSRESMVQVSMGQTLRIVNDDSIIHRLHTNGSPCDHGPDIQVGTSFDCIIGETHDPDSDGVLYDHRAGSSSEFWVKANP